MVMACAIANVCETSAAALKFASPSCEAVTVQVPAPVIVIVAPLAPLAVQVLLAADAASPSYDAVMECDPTERPLVVYVARPWLSSTRLATTLPPSKKL